ncbi:hypothetical protein [Nocardia acidivorans]|uniref:hypothetical protein n=1 Tax=Nocardia acidivorans TaxID=404580 RepID=UPI0008370F7F|nr:hypothetical protein [Nocardia acidivorans]
MHNNHITLNEAIAQLNDRAPHIVNGAPLWTLTNRSFGFEISLHLPAEYAELGGVSTANDVSWMIFDGPEPVDAIKKALAELDILNAQLAAKAVAA